MNEEALKLIDAICEAYDIYHVPKDGATFCNLAVQHICARMGFDRFRGMVANQMVDMLKRSLEWEKIVMEEAQPLANEGRLVIAGIQDNPHGHVAVVRPGLEEFSRKWEKRVPKICQVGGTSYIGKSLAWAFAAEPEIWVLKA